MNRWTVCALLVYALQAAALGVDEFYLHHKRDLPAWERWGHPLDTFSVLAPTLLSLLLPLNENTFFIFLILGLLSCLLVTKDEWIHARACSGLEHWLHAVLFVCHPLAFVSTAYFWAKRDQVRWLHIDGSDAPQFAGMVLLAQTALLVLFLIYQIIYWNFFRGKVVGSGDQLNFPTKRSMSADPQQSV